MSLIKNLLALSLAFTSAFATAEPGVTDNEILIGQFAATSGPAAQLGLRMQVGMQAYFTALNAQGGVNGRSIKLVTRDDGYEPDKAVAAVKALIEQDKVFALAGSVGTPTGLAALPVVTAQQVPLVGMFTGAQALREPFNRHVFHVRASYFDETERIVQHLTTLGVKKIAVFYQNDSYGKAGLEGVERALTQRQLKPVATGTVERNSVDTAAALASILKTEPEAVVQISAYKSCAAFIKQARSKGYGGQFFNVSFVGAAALAQELGDAGQGVVISQVVPFPFATKTPVVRDYQQHMLAAGQKEFDFSSMEGYLTARVLTEGLRRAGKTPTRDSLISGLESLRDVNLGGFAINYSPKNHQGSNFTDLSIIGRGGKFMH
ncbi:ABC transporter substrate-binding protein [Rhodoferax sp.]|uniref:ABC transporter substrate-binding protein n=1 Tax=Rhodoferax sp. TaxID=50421 RepID=UPI0026036B9A|nr:ABC transporter substrate-binding protein [Rhodoferax sp.]MDD2809138.1 ABC transporter substrate-binding protein [Rhodoferax sp.]